MCHPQLLSLQGRHQTRVYIKNERHEMESSCMHGGLGSSCAPSTVHWCTSMPFRGSSHSFVVTKTTAQVLSTSAGARVTGSSVVTHGWRSRALMCGVKMSAAMFAWGVQGLSHMDALRWRCRCQIDLKQGQRKRVRRNYSEIGTGE